MGEERVSKLEDRIKKCIIRKTNVRIMGIPKGEERERKGQFT